VGNFIIFQYHKITNRFEIGGTWLPRKFFENHLKFLKYYGFTSPSLKEIFAYPKVEGKRALITFDDGFSSIYEEAFPIMEKYGFKGIVFIITGYIGSKNLWEPLFMRRFRHLNWSELRELQKAGWIIGSHTHTHPDLTKLDGVELLRELETSRKILEDGLGSEIFFLSFPYGRWNERVKESVVMAGYRRAFASARDDPFLLKRRGIYLIDWNISAKLENSGPIFFIENIKERSIQSLSSLSAWVRHRGIRKLLGISIPNG
jgi:peptidoglycan/xylan/chitin deacetylase (PgdA/CDA1 family)